ncbi:HNH endonuclease [Peribacillus simplex]|uniref:HNH endonuclease n=1 Tax=Peribacillus simplex TaxID=1478 RepID=UPI0011A287E2|nr:HNH endonuclease [Peribacillus simplex]
MILLVEKRDGTQLEYRMDAEDLPLLEGKRLHVTSGHLAFTEKGKTVFVKDWIMNLPNNRVTHFDNDLTNLHKDNLCVYGIRNVHYVVGDILVVEIESKGTLHRALFDAEDEWLLHKLDCKFSINKGGYIVYGNPRSYVHRYIAEQHWGNIESLVIDHLLGSKHDNRKSQLRPVTQAENVWSKHKAQEKSGFPNVKEYGDKWLVHFKQAPERNVVCETFEEAVKCSHVIRPFVYGDYKGTVGSFENMVKTIKGGR